MIFQPSSSAGMPFLDRSFNRNEFGLDASQAFEQCLHTRRSLPYTRHFKVKGYPGFNADTIVINTHGSFIEDGTQMASASIGVYFGYRSSLNVHKRVPLNLSQTSQFAELYAVHQALRTVLNKYPFVRGRTFIIATDSLYVVEGLSSWVGVWRTNGYVRRYGGTKIANANIFERLDALILHLEGKGARILFWKIERHENQPAIDRASWALGWGVDPWGALWDL